MKRTSSTTTAPATLAAAAERQLSAYALAAVAGAGALTSAQVANAGILSFTYTNQVLAPGGNATSTFQLFTLGPTLSLRNLGSFSFYIGAVASNGLNLVNGGNNYAANLTAGAAVSAGQTFLAPRATVIGYTSAPNGPFFGNFRNQTGFLGFRFNDPTVPTQTDYGWARIGLNAQQSQMTIVSAAYDNTGARISAGQVPEPGTLGLLAGGAAGLALWRRRKAKAAGIVV